jgi:ATP-dependent DNA helicase UvrD/PcrA
MASTCVAGTVRSGRVAADGSTPRVIVDAVNDVIAAAKANGNLEGRIDKPFRCYLPDKQAVSEAHPKINYAQCTVQSTKAPYPGQYIAEQIAAIPAQDIRESKEGGYPTVLVIGDRPFGPAAHDVVKVQFPQTQMREASPSLLNALEGYRRIAQNANSRLGWRIITLCFPFDGVDDIVREALETDADLAPLLPTRYHDHHLAIAELVLRLRDGEVLTSGHEKEVARAVGMEIAEIKDRLGVVEEDEDPLPEDEEAKEADEDAPTIRFTSLIASKGLSAAYVFIVGFNNGFFPRDPNGITDDEVCKLLVALSRTRVECHLVSCGHFGKAFLNESAFADWIRPHLEPISISKEHFAT